MPRMDAMFFARLAALALVSPSLQGCDNDQVDVYTTIDGNETGSRVGMPTVTTTDTTTITTTNGVQTPTPTTNPATPMPTSSPSNRKPSPMPTSSPSQITGHMDLLKKIRDSVNHPDREFLASVKVNMTDEINLDMGGSAQDEMGIFGGACQVKYDVGAHVETCNGLKKMGLSVDDDVSVDVDASGKITVTLLMELSAGPISCTATAFARGSACGLALDVAAKVQPSVSVDKSSMKALMNVVDGTGAFEGKTCLQTSRLEVTSGGKLTWGDLPISLFSGKEAKVPFLKQEIPDSVLNAVWERASLEGAKDMMGTFVDQASSSFGLNLEDVTGALKDLVGSSLESQLQTMSHCF